MNFKIIILAILLHNSLCAQFGPGGVGNATNNGLWLKADNISSANGAPVAAWRDLSGNDNHASNSTLSEQPVFRVSSAINGRPSVYFDGGLDQMIIQDADILDGTSSITFYTVIRPDNLDNGPRGILGKRTDQSTSTNYAYTFFFFNSNYLFLDIDRQNDRFNTGPISFSNNTNYMLGFDFDGSRSSSIRSRLLSAGNVIKVSNESSTSIPNSNEPLVLGGLNLNYSNGGIPRLGGDYSEVIHYNKALNTAERKIVENYLGAKYGIAIVNDLYTHQGGYAGEVAGIGRDNAANFHDDAQGSAMVRINTPSSLGDGDFMIWGHNESSLDVYDKLDVDGTLIESRMSRVWAVTKTNDVGTVTVTFDHSQFSPINPSDLRLLIDSDGDGFDDNDVTPIVGTVSGSSIIFTGVEFADKDRFTLGSINFNQTPLPVELTLFNVESNKENVEVKWSTASELNADYYFVSKSNDGKHFKVFGKVQANGTTSTVSKYSFIDKTPYSGISYYKLTQVDFDGKLNIYEPISINREQEQLFVLVPNPTNGAFKLKSSTSTDSKTLLTIYTSMGKMVKQIVLEPSDINTNFIDLSLQSGIYHVKVSQENGEPTSLKLVVQ